MSDVYEKVVETISQMCGIERARISPETDLTTELRVDSLLLLEVATEIGAYYGVDVPISQWSDEINAGEAPPSQYFVVKNLVQNIERLVTQQVAASC